VPQLCMAAMKVPWEERSPRGPRRSVPDTGNTVNFNQSRSGYADGGR